LKVHIATVVEELRDSKQACFETSPKQLSWLCLLQSKLDVIPELSNVKGMGPKLIQIARSTPGIVATLVGHKSKPHVLANVALSNIQPLTLQQFTVVMAALAS